MTEHTLEDGKRMPPGTPIPPGGAELAQRAAKALFPYLRQADLVVRSEWMPMGVRHLVGTHTVGDEPADTPELRSGRCFELAGHAIAFAGIVPAATRLVHGSIHGHDENMIRIGHAWLILPGDLVWEPYSSCIYDKDEWYKAARAWDEVSYTSKQAQQNILAQMNWGSWHGSRYPTKPPVEEEIDPTKWEIPKYVPRVTSEKTRQALD